MNEAMTYVGVLTALLETQGHWCHESSICTDATRVTRFLVANDLASVTHHCVALTKKGKALALECAKILSKKE